MHTCDNHADCAAKERCSIYVEIDVLCIAEYTARDVYPAIVAVKPEMQAPSSSGLRRHKAFPFFDYFFLLATVPPPRPVVRVC